MENEKLKKQSKRLKFVTIKRSQKEWDQIINEAKNKESSWKYIKEYFNDELLDRENETV